MYTSALFTAILAGSALALHPVQELVRRQTLTNDIIPSACQSTCSSSLPIYNACLSGDQTTCLTVCDDANFDPFVACFNCIIQNVPGGSSGQFQQAQQLISQLEAACGQDGSSVSGSALSTAFDASATAASPSATDAGASFTSASSGITIGAGSSTGGLASITSNVAASASSASRAVGSSAASASQSGAGAASSSAPNAGVMTAPNGIFAVILGAIGALAL